MKAYDTVFSIEDFVKIVNSKKGDLNDTRISVHYKTIGEYTVRVTVLLSIRLKDRILRCIVSRKDFNRYLAFDEKTEEHKKYEDWLKESYNTVETKLKFKPIDGYWK